MLNVRHTTMTKSPVHDVTGTAAIEAMLLIKPFNSQFTVLLNILYHSVIIAIT